MVSIVIVEVEAAVVEKSVPATRDVPNVQPPPADELTIVIAPAAFVMVIPDPGVIVLGLNPVPSPISTTPLAGGVPERTSASSVEGIVTVPVNVGDAVGAREVSDA